MMNRLSRKDTVGREVKFRAASGFRLPGFPGEYLLPRIITSTYYDTKEHRLGRLGLTLRRRVERGKGTWQIKLPDGPSRLELEMPGGPGNPPREFMDLLFAFLRKSELITIAKLRTKRVGFQVRQAEKSLAKITQDSVSILNGRRIVHRFFEIEVVRTEGDETILSQITQTLLEAGAQKGDPRPKIFQALDLAYPMELPLIDASASAADHLKAMLYAQTTEILLHDPGTRLGKDSESLHRMRVATRRVRALLRAARPLLKPDWAQTIRAEIGWVGRILGTVRDFDVLLQELHDEIKSLTLSEQKAFERLLDSFETQRSIARASLLDALRSDRYLDLLNRLQNDTLYLATVPAQITLPQIATKEFRNLRKTVVDLNTNYSDEDLHRVRIRAKRARYAAELAENAVGKQCTRFIRLAKKFQTLLGKHQDSVITEQRLREVLRVSRGVNAAVAVGQIIERLRFRREKVRGLFSRRWTKLKKHGRQTWLSS